MIKIIFSALLGNLAILYGAINIIGEINNIYVYRHKIVGLYLASGKSGLVIMLAKTPYGGAINKIKYAVNNPKFFKR
jgi:hypothetical protein